MKNCRQFSYILIFIGLLNLKWIYAYQKTTYMVPMRDGIHLATDLYQSSTDTTALPTILIRTPYGRENAELDWFIQLLTDVEQYNLVIQDTRGRFASEGADSMYFSDGWGRVRDGYDTVEWIAEQSWSDGHIGTWGASAMGITQYLLTGTAPPHLSCCLVMVGAANLYEDAIFYGGVYRESLMDTWLKANNSEHLIDFFVNHPDYSSVYDPINLSARYDSVNVPILHIGGWHDIFIEGQINAFCGIQANGGPNAKNRQQLIVGPWTHNLLTSAVGELTFPNSSAFDLFTLTLDWYDYWLKNKDNGVTNQPAVRYYIMGDADEANGPGNLWLEREDWPPPCQIVPFYLRENGLLSTAPPSADEAPESFDFDPLEPVPTLGGRNLNLKAGSYDQRTLEDREDVLVYTTAVLNDTITVSGNVSVDLWASSDALDTDFTAKLCDVYPDGRSMLVEDGIIMARHRESLETEELLVPGNIYLFKIDLWSTAIAFAPGHRIRLTISSSNSTRFATNPNTGEAFRKNTHTQIAHQTVYHNTIHASALNLPVTDWNQSAVKQKMPEPIAFILGPNYPNPFNQETVIPVQSSGHDLSAQKSTLEIEITDIKGRIIEKRICEMNGNRTEIIWNASSGPNGPLASGVYICKLVAGSQVLTRKMVLLR